MFREVTRLPEFEKDMRKLLKRFRTLEEDLDNFIKFGMVPYHKLAEDNGGIVRIPNLGFDQPKIFKARKFACRSMKGKGVQSGIRVIYAYFDEEDKIELIEIYYKGDKESEDRKRIINEYR
jgi:mRNA-degrading endonuclease RelE of RelBE toxin-antitoxin system